MLSVNILLALHVVRSDSGSYGVFTHDLTFPGEVRVPLGCITSVFLFLLLRGLKRDAGT